MTILLHILAVGTVLGFLGLIVATVIRRQYLYSIGFLCALGWIVFTMLTVKGLLEG